MKGDLLAPPNVINLSKRQLSKDEISLLSKELKFVPTPSYINKAKIKEILEIFVRKLGLMCHFRNDEQSFVNNPFKKSLNLIQEIRTQL